MPARLRPAPALLILCLALTLLACGGGGGGANADPAFDVGDGLPSGGGGAGTGNGGGGAGGGGVPAGLNGGVLATFTAAGETFRWWVTEPTLAQRLVDSWSGAAAPITRMDAPVLQGQGASAHNAPWNWFVHPGGNRVVFNATIAPTICFPYWLLPSEVEAGFAGGPPFPCVDVNAGANWGEMRMSVALTDVQDLR